MKVANLQIRVERTAYRAFVVMILIPSIVICVYTAVLRPLELDVSTVIMALCVGICFAIYHEIAQFVHQLGHALAAYITGYPMTGIRYDAVFTYSEYPPNEPALPDKVHIQRSLGGVIALALLLLFVLFVWRYTDVTMSAFVHWALNFMLFDSLLLFIASAVLSDGFLFIRNKSWKAT